jgi:uncharacterized membrane protein
MKEKQEPVHIVSYLLFINFLISFVMVFILAPVRI